jgi:transposase-like protein
MKAKSRRQFTSEFKVKVVLEVLRQEKTLNQIASDYDLHPQLVQTWKQAFMAAAPQVFEQQKGAEKPVADQTAPLYEQIGRLQMELSWLKKKWGTTL